MDSDFERSEQIEEAAVRWFVRQQGEAWTDADQAELDAWLAAATAHRIHYIRVTTAWNHAARLKALGAGVPSGVIPPRGSWGDTRFPMGVPAETEPPMPASGLSDVEERSSDRLDNAAAGTLAAASTGTFKPRRWFNWSFAAAAVLILLAAGVYLLNAGWFGGTHYSTPVGGMENVLLADGSNVTLDTDTRIRVSLTENERRIQLERGEAFFEVAKDELRPFIVYAGDKRVVAVGTKFAVRRDDDDIRVIVTEGRVKLAVADVPAEGDRPDAPETPAPSNAISTAGSWVPPSTFLDAGAIARTAKSEVLVRTAAASEAEKLLSWRRGYVSFDNIPLADAVAEFNRYITRKIFIEDPGIAAIRVGGNFRSTNTGAFLDLLQSGFPIAVEHENDRVILKER